MENRSGLGIKGNGGGRPMSTEEVERELEDTRREMRETLDAILSRTFPSSALWRQMRENLGAPGDFAANLGATVQRNPLPAAVATIGLAWLIWRDARPAPPRETKTRAAERLEEAQERLASSAAEGREHMRSSAELWAIRARRTGGDVGDYAQRLLRDQPLVAGMVALAAGALIGAALPRTRVEAERLGPIRNRAVEGAARPAQEGTVEAAAKSEAETETAERARKTKGRGKGRRRH